TASDGESGLASDPSGAVPVSTANAGVVTTTRTAIDNVGHETTRFCVTRVREQPPEFGRCAKVAGEVVGGKTTYHGFFTSSTCVLESATHSGQYEWTSGVVKTAFSTAIKPTTKAIFETIKKVKVTCTGESTTGTITSSKGVGNIVI